jgi:hypothetical protein
MTRFRPQWILIIGGLLLIVASLVAGLGSPTLAQGPDDGTPNPLGEEPSFLAEYYETWVESPHADFTDDAFRHWDEDGAVPERCAACHAAGGYLDFVGADGSEAGVVDMPHSTDTVVNCDVCHHPVAANLQQVTFPSGVTVTDLGDSVRCMVCHSGRASTMDVNNSIEEAGLTGEPDTVGEELRFINQHFYAAAATLYGAEVMGGYQYSDALYQGQFDHVEGFDTCDDCHDPHSLELVIEPCATCHEGVETVEDLRDIRMAGSLIDYDGDGDMEEGIYYELETLQQLLYANIQAYAANVVGTPIIYAESYPYFFIDTDGNGEVNEGEAIFPNAYNAFTPSLLRATYNYQVAQKDPGGYAHNAKYHIELLYDSIDALASSLGDDAVDVAQLQRDDPGHFNTTSDSWRHWDEDGEVSARCSQCHTAEGLPFFIEHGVNIAFEPSDEMECSTCHNDLAEFTLYELDSVVMPSGVEISFGEGEGDNFCLVCHQGRQSGVGIQSAIDSAAVGDDEVTPDLRFSNPHYFATGSALFGADAEGAYQYPGMEYNGQFEHARRYDSCSGCHDVHATTVYETDCIDCHEGLDEEDPDLETIRFDEDFDPVDYNGNGDVEEGVAFEIATYEQLLFDSIIEYAANEIGTPIGFGSRYPYWFIDTNGDGMIDGDEASRDNAYASWTPTLLRGVYNYMFFHYTPGSYAHNPDYTLQVLYDTIADIGGEEAVADFTRAPVRDDD